jgi:hypothetical protein
MTGSGCCRLCGGPWPPRRPGAGRPRSKCDACRDLRRPPVVPNWDSDLVRAVQREYPDDSDPFVYLAWMLAADLLGATHAKDAVPLSKELGRSLAIWMVAGNLGAIRMVWMSCGCGGSTADLRDEWLP